MNKKWPFIQWFVTDWLADANVSVCSPETRGIWFDWLCNMHSLDRCGQITGSREILARLGRCTDRQCDAALRELKESNAADVTERNGIVTVVNRRMKREYMSRFSASQRVKKHRGNAPVTVHNQSQYTQILEPEPEDIPRQCSQSSANGGHANGNGELSKLTLRGCSLDRVATEILSNKNGWFYDNCKVNPGLFRFPKSLVTVLKPFVERIAESQVHSAWSEAVRRTHGAVVDGLVNEPAGYVIECWREALEAECGREVLSR